MVFSLHLIPISSPFCYFVSACQLDCASASLRENGKQSEKKLNKTQQTAISFKAWVTAVSRGSWHFKGCQVFRIFLIIPIFLAPKPTLLSWVKGFLENWLKASEKLDSIRNSMDIGLSKLREIVKDREAWRAAVHGVTKSGTWLSNWTTIKSEKHLYLKRMDWRPFLPNVRCPTLSHVNPSLTLWSEIQHCWAPEGDKGARDRAQVCRDYICIRCFLPSRSAPPSSKSEAVVSISITLGLWISGTLKPWLSLRIRVYFPHP